MHAVLPPVLAIMGPTASGKTRLAIELAQALSGEIISVDSGLVYRGMDIGTAKPSMAERCGVPHHLIDIVDPSEAFSTGQFREKTRSLMDDILSRGRLPILAGGTMLYFNALLHGLADLPAADPAIRSQLDEQASRIGWVAMHEQLRQIDPVAAARIHPNDPQRIQRALEVYYVSGSSLTALQQATARQPDDLPCRIQRIELTFADRDSLRARIAARFHLMLKQGFVAEVEMLYQRGDLDENLPSMRAVGYRQAWSYLRGECSYDEFVERAIIATRQFAKRQLTWLRREAGQLSYDAEADKIAARVLSDVKNFMERS
ncbi:tRNA (adenosine(37)-N6)-dimethylallyltransferase MiaA [Candidatus Methylospira mobilis]|nr:tRNA (adenosine(37)-N6)-dimethylallyltransferase MiaA [Candidatus Methylospira mobilis]WNV03932.1 tRNA (adenosine(37)-N6)-dimethylallyltransferase MiaA [Candidatus Methylospira mobilis]